MNLESRVDTETGDRVYRLVISPADLEEVQLRIGDRQLLQEANRHGSIADYLVVLARIARRIEGTRWAISEDVQPGHPEVRRCSCGKPPLHFEEVRYPPPVTVLP